MAEKPRIPEGVRLPDDVTTKMLGAAQQRWEGGDKSALLQTLFYCLYFEIVPPHWLADAFADAFFQVTNFQANSWDDVFGKPHPKGAKISARRRHSEIEMSLYLRVRELSKTEAVDTGLFERVGNEFSVSGSVASRLYYAVLHEGGYIDYCIELAEAIKVNYGPHATGDEIAEVFTKEGEKVQNLARTLISQKRKK